MLKPFLRLFILSPLIVLHGQNQSVDIQRGVEQRRNYDLEVRKIELEERRLYLSLIQSSRISEAKAREVGEWILKNLKDYPQGKKAKNFEEDVRLLVETIASLQKQN